jgi:hypothetical protein
MNIAPRYNGPPGSGNGGFCAGLFATSSGLTADALEVTLRMPPPLEVDLAVLPSPDGVEVRAGDDLVAQVRPTVLAPDETVAPVGWDEALAASAGYPGFANHPFPTCFVCGPERGEGDGLRLFPGRLPDGRTATPWVVPDDISPTLVWASLDCPGGWAVPLERCPYVLGRLAVRSVRLPQAADRCVVMGEITGEDGRKAFTRTTLYDRDGGVLALARATWIALQ